MVGSQADLFNKARHYTQVNKWSVIPIKGEAALPGKEEKEPGIFWTRYQTEIASPALIKNWFTGKNAFPALAIVTGSISKLAVLDFDTLPVYESFTQAFPELVNTYTVLSGNRKLPHLYYKLVPFPLINATSTRQRPRGHRWNGADFQYGGYVLAPPTVIRGKEWRCIREDVRVLTIAEYLQIVEWFEGQGGSPEALSPSVNQPVTWSPASSRTNNTNAQNNADLESGQPEPLRPSVNEPVAGELPEQHTDNASQSTRRQQYTATTLISQYHQRCLSQGGRNNALFSAALDARNDGWLESEVKHALIMPHAAKQKHDHYELGDKRMREAERTIASAFSRPARDKASAAPSRRVPNSLREYFLTTYGGYLARVYEALLTDLRAGQYFTSKDAREICAKYGVGDWSVRRALETEFFFSPPQPPPHANADIDTSVLTIITCSNDRRKKPTKTGRKAARYRLPSPNNLIKRLELDKTGSDKIPLEALASVATYRAHKLLAMLPRFKWPKMWKFAQILGVTGRTIYNYFILLELRTRPKIQAMRLTWGTISQHLPKENETTPGAWLQTATNRYPAKWPIAANLLAAKEPVNFCYVAGVDIGADASAPRLDHLPTSESPRAEQTTKTPTKKRKTRLKGRDKALAETIYTAIPELSYKNAERYVQDYGRDLVYKVWQRVEAIAKHKTITSRAGYLATLLRTDPKTQERKTLNGINPHEAYRGVELPAN